MAIEYPILDELHAIRERLWEEAGGTMEGFARMIREREQQHPERLVDLSGRMRGQSKAKGPKKPPAKKKAKSR